MPSCRGALISATLKDCQLELWSGGDSSHFWGKTLALIGEIVETQAIQTGHHKEQPVTKTLSRRHG